MIHKLLVVLGAVVISCGLTGCSSLDQNVLPGPRVCHAQICRSVEVATDPAALQKGLMNRTELGQLSGMLFVFPQTGSRPFWMKNTLIPLDMIWLDSAGKVLYIQADAPPCTADPCPSYGPPADTQASYVVEMNAGSAERFAISVGDAFLIDK